MPVAIGLQRFVPVILQRAGLAISADSRSDVREACRDVGQAMRSQIDQHRTARKRVDGLQHVARWYCADVAQRLAYDHVGGEAIEHFDIEPVERLRCGLDLRIDFPRRSSRIEPCTGELRQVTPLPRAAVADADELSARSQRNKDIRRAGEQRYDARAGRDAHTIRRAGAGPNTLGAVRVST